MMARGLKFRIYIYRKYRVCTIYVAKTKALISFGVTAKLICVFVFAYAKSWFSHDAAQINMIQNDGRQEADKSVYCLSDVLKNDCVNCVIR